MLSVGLAVVAVTKPGNRAWRGFRDELSGMGEPLRRGGIAVLGVAANSGCWQGAAYLRIITFWALNSAVTSLSSCRSMESMLAAVMVI